MCQHKKKYGLEASWVFYATSHGKSTCDIIGGTLKRSISRESLRREYNNQIMSVEGIHEYSEKEISSIKTIVVSKEEINQSRKLQSTNPNTIPGTRNFHEFIIGQLVLLVM